MAQQEQVPLYSYCDSYTTAITSSATLARIAAPLFQTVGARRRKAQTLHSAKYLNICSKTIVRLLLKGGFL